MSSYTHFVDLVLFQDIDAPLPFLQPAFLKAFHDAFILHRLAPFCTTLLQQLLCLFKILRDLARPDSEAQNLLFARLNLVSSEGLQVGNLFSDLLNLPGVILKFVFEIADHAFRFFYRGLRGINVGLAHFDEPLNAIQAASGFTHWGLLTG
jgi:hypothetical protein